VTLSQTYQLTYDQAVKLANDAVVQKGVNFNYLGVRPNANVCLNWHDDDVSADGKGQPGCLVGQVFTAIVGREVMSDPEYSSGVVATLLINLGHQGHHVVIEDEAREFLGYVQMKQDAGYSWSVAIGLWYGHDYGLEYYDLTERRVAE
jgi:hypothetical protein